MKKKSLHKCRQVLAELQHRKPHAGFTDIWLSQNAVNEIVQTMHLLIDEVEKLQSLQSV